MQPQAEKIFAYWDDDDRSRIAEFIDEWQSSFPSFQVFGKNDVYALIRRYSPEHLDLFNSLRIASARSDIARLFLLYELGGLYIDVHFGRHNKTGISDVFSKLKAQFEIVVVDRDRKIFPRPFDEYYFINGAIFARPGNPLLLMCAHQALANLECQRKFERLFGHTYYHVAVLTGPSVLTTMLLDAKCVTRSLRNTLRPDYANRIAVVPEESLPMTRNVHSAYRLSGQHWSERQIAEKLFND